MSLIRIPAGEKVPDRINAVVETPLRSRGRYEYDERYGAFRLVARLAGGTAYPADYGFIPSTMAEDGYPLDVFIVADEPTFPGCVVECRPVAVLHLSDGTRPDHKILAVPVDSESCRDFHDLTDVPAALIDGISALFGVNPRISGAPEQIVGWEGAEAARRVIFLAWEGFLV